jgi:hypothetical protein
VPRGSPARPVGGAVPPAAIAVVGVGRLIGLEWTAPGVDDPGRVARRGRGVHVGEVQVVSAAVPGVAVVANPPPGRARMVRLGLGQMREPVDLVPVAAASAVGNDVEREPDRVLAVWRVDPGGGVAVGDEDVESPAQPVDIAEQASIDSLTGEARDVDEPPAADRLAEVGPELGAPHLAARRDRRHAERGAERSSERREHPPAAPSPSVASPTGHDHREADRQDGCHADRGAGRKLASRPLAWPAGPRPRRG